MHERSRKTYEHPIDALITFSSLLNTSMEPLSELEAKSLMMLVSGGAHLQQTESLLGVGGDRSGPTPPFSRASSKDTAV